MILFNGSRMAAILTSFFYDSFIHTTTTRDECERHCPMLYEIILNKQFWSPFFRQRPTSFHRRGNEEKKNLIWPPFLCGTSTKQWKGSERECEWKMWWFVIFLVRSFWSAIQHSFPPQKRVRKNLSYSQKCWTLHPSRKKKILQKSFFFHSHKRVRALPKPKPTRAVTVVRWQRLENEFNNEILRKEGKSVADMCRRQQLNLWTQLRSDLRLFGSSVERENGCWNIIKRYISR